MAYKTREDVNQEKRDVAYAAAREQGFQEIFQAYPTIPRSIANEREVEDLCDGFLGVGRGQVAPALSTFRSVVEANPGILAGKIGVYVTPIEKQKAEIVEEILELIASKDGGRDGKFNSYNLRSEEARMKSWSLDALRNRLNEIKTKQAMNSIPVSTLKSFVQDARKDTNPYPGYATLPAHFDTSYLRGLSAFEFRRAQAKYSSQQLTDRLQGKI